MPAAITDQVVSSAPGAKCTITGTGLTGGGPASVMLAGQGADGTTTTDLTASATFAATSVSFVCPDGARDGVLTVTAVDSSTATVPLRVNAQYVLASEYIGQGDDTSDFATGELDVILRAASGYCDAYLSRGSAEAMSYRILQTAEQAKWRRRSRRVYPRRRPIVSVDSFQYVASPALKVAFNPGDFVVVPDLEYIELVVWSTGYTMIEAVANATMYDAGVCLLTYTAGYPWAHYPQALREATKIVANELISQRGISADGMSGFSRVRTGLTQYDRKGEAFAMPEPAITLLSSLRSFRAG